MKFPKWRFWLGCGLSVVLSVAALVVLAALARDSGSRILVSTLSENSTAIGTAVRLKLERALAVGISIDQLIGVEKAFKEELRENRELSFFALVGSEANILAFVGRDNATELELNQMKRLAQFPKNVPKRSGQDETEVQVPPEGRHSFEAIRIPVAETPDGASKATLIVGYPENYIDQHLNALATDLIVAVLITLVLVLEFLWFGSQLSAVRDLGQFRAFVKRLALRRFEFRALMGTRDPMGELSRALDGRLDSLKQRFQKLMEVVDKTPALFAGATSVVQTDLVTLGQRFGLLTEPQGLPSSLAISHYRIAIFLVAMSEEICRPFFAVYGAELVGPAHLSPQLLSGIPLTAFLIFWGGSQPFGIAVMKKFGVRRWLTTAAAILGVGMVCTALTDNWYIVVALRALTGFCFGSMLICSLSLMIRSGVNGLASYITALVAAGICGPVIGGLLASTFGYATAFLVAAGCAFLAIAFISPSSIHAGSGSHRPGSVMATLKSMLGRELMSLLLFSTIPSRMMTTALLLIIVPLTILNLDESAAVAGRIMLLYFFALFLLAGNAEKLATRWNAAKAFIICGGVVVAGACLAGYALNDIWGMVAVCALLGVGQALMVGSQANLAIQMMDQAASADVSTDLSLGMYRLFDRLGAATGPMIAAVLIQQYGLRNVMLWLACGMSICTLLYLLSFIALKDRGQMKRELT